MITYSILCIGDSTYDKKLKDLLESWSASALYENLRDCGINFKNLKFLDECDYNILMKGDLTMLGSLITFRAFHRKWKMNVASEAVSQNYLGPSSKVGYDSKLL